MNNLREHITNWIAAKKKEDELNDTVNKLSDDLMDDINNGSGVVRATEYNNKMQELFDATYKRDQCQKILLRKLEEGTENDDQ